ncbi:hypothetical protein [Clostridium sp. DJ247]|nr:hypothetical protein [Clostridium sp. DJ247]MBC2581750.1 hypothetical protein [Clostridium sp. DJ247]
MSVELIGSKVENKSNFMTVAWISMVSYNLAKSAITLENYHLKIRV